jgi:hypothetical protein
MKLLYVKEFKEEDEDEVDLNKWDVMFAKKFNQEELFDLLNGVANSRLI